MFTIFTCCVDNTFPNISIPSHTKFFAPPSTNFGNICRSRLVCSSYSANQILKKVGNIRTKKAKKMLCPEHKPTTSQHKKTNNRRGCAVDRFARSPLRSSLFLFFTTKTTKGTNTRSNHSKTTAPQAFKMSTPGTVLSR